MAIRIMTCAAWDFIRCALGFNLHRKSLTKSEDLRRHDMFLTFFQGRDLFGVPLYTVTHSLQSLALQELQELVNTPTICLCNSAFSVFTGE